MIYVSRFIFDEQAADWVRRWEEERALGDCAVRIDDVGAALRSVVLDEHPRRVVFEVAVRGVDGARSYYFVARRETFTDAVNDVREALAAVNIDPDDIAAVEEVIAVEEVAAGDEVAVEEVAAGEEARPSRPSPRLPRRRSEAVEEAAGDA